jgi:hypothetical protein
MTRHCLASLALSLVACTTPQSGQRASGPTPHQMLRTPAKPGLAASSCSFTPCGGSVLGAWDFSESCAAPISMGDPACPASSGSVTPAYTGKMVFNQDSTYYRSISVTGPLTLNLPASCVTVPCSQIAHGMNKTGYYTGVTCSSTGSGGCSCTGQMAGSPQVDEGTYAYTTTGPDLIITPYPTFNLPAETNPFCVNNGQFKISIDSSGSVLTGTQSAK